MTDIHNNQVNIRNDYIKAGKIDSRTDDLWMSSLESLPQGAAGIGLGIVSPRLATAYFVGEAMARTGADMYALGAEKRSDGTIIAGTGDVNDALVGNVVGIPIGFVESFLGPDRIARTAIHQALKTSIGKVAKKVVERGVKKGVKSLGIKATKKKAGDVTIGEVVKDWLTGSLQEGGEEVFQGLITQATEIGLGYRE